MWQGPIEQREWLRTLNKTWSRASESGHEPISVASCGIFRNLDRPTPSHVTSVCYSRNLRIEFHDGFTDDLSPWRRVGEGLSPPGPVAGTGEGAGCVPRLWLGSFQLLSSTRRERES